MATPDLSRKQARLELLDWPEVGNAIGFYGDGALGSQSLTDEIKLGGHRAGNWFANQGQVVFPSNPVTDRFRDPSTLTAGGVGTLALKGSAIAAGNQSASIHYEFIKRGLSYEKINEAFFNACMETYYMQRSAVGGIFDADFVQPDFDGWIRSNPGVLLDFDAAAELNDSGYYSMVLDFTTTLLDTLYVRRTSPIHMEAGEQFHLAGLCKIVAGGPAYWDVVNESTNTTLRDRVTVTHTGEWFRVGGNYSSAAAGNYNLHLGAAAGTIVAWDCFPNHYTLGLSWDGPDYLNQRYKLDRIDVYNYARQVEVDLATARSRQYSSWRRRQDFDLEVLAAESNPNRIQVLPPRTSLPEADLFYRVKRLVSDVYDPDETTPLPGDDNVREQITAAFRIQVLGMLEERDRLGPNGLWMRKAAELGATQDAHRIVEEEQIQPVQEYRRRHMSV